MMKRSLILVLSLLMLVLCIPALAESTDWNYDANYAILRGYDGAGGDVPCLRKSTASRWT